MITNKDKGRMLENLNIAIKRQDWEEAIRLLDTWYKIGYSDGYTNRCKEQYRE